MVNLMGLEIPKEGPKIEQVRERKEEKVEKIEVNSFSLFDFAEENRMAIAMIGNSNTGKTHAGVIELMEYLVDERIHPDDILIEYIDLDGGVAQLLRQRTFPKEYFKRINYTPCNRFAVVEEATNQAFRNLETFTKDHSLKGAWIVVDNTKRAWRWVQDDYCRAVYGISLTEKMEKARKSQIEAKKRGPDAKGEGVFNRNLDYSVITPIHNDWFVKFGTCPYNVLLLSPWSQEELKDPNNSSKVVGYKDRWGQGDNELIPDYIIKKYFGPNRERLADFTKSRSTSNLPTQIRNPTIKNIFETLAKLEEHEAKERKDKLKGKVFPKLSQGEKENAELKTIPDSKKEEDCEEIDDAEEELDW